MERTFEWSVLEGDKPILRVWGRGGRRMTPELAVRVQQDLMELGRFIHSTFGERSFRLLSILEDMSLALDKEEEMVAQGSIAMGHSFPVERGAYVTDKATMRIQYNRMFRENRFEHKYRTFATEREALEYLRAP